MFLTGRPSALGRLPLNTIRRILLAQLLLTASLAGGIWALAGMVQARSLFVGGMICVLPNAFLALRMFAHGRDADPRRIVRAAYFGEVGKLALTALFFAAAFLAIKPLSAGYLFAGYILAQSIFWVALVIEKPGPGPSFDNRR